MSGYVEYLQNERSAWHSNFMKRMQAVQQAKNAAAPIVSGSNSSGNGTGVAQVYSKGATANSSYSGKLDFTGLAKGKVLPTSAKVSQNWGKSRIKYAAGRHTGMDFGGPTGTGVRAAASGVVVAAGSEGAYGNRIKIRHSDGTTTLYGHLSAINVKAGQKVKVGSGIGKIGNTGRSFGSHLHFEVRKADKYGGDINPMSWYGR